MFLETLFDFLATTINHYGFALAIMTVGYWVCVTGYELINFWRVKHGHK